MTKKKNIKGPKNIKKYIYPLVAVFVVFGIGYFVGLGSMKILSKKDTSNGYQKIDIVDDAVVTTLMKNLTAGSDCWNIEEYANDHKVDVKSISDERIYQVVQWGSFYNKGKSTITLDEFNAEIKNYFSIGYSFDPNKISSSSSCNPFSYNENTQEFVALKLACQDLCGPNKTQYKIMDVEDDGFHLTVTVNVLFGSQAEKVAYYSDYERTNFITDDYEHLDQYYDQGDSYLFTFLRVDNQYLYVSSEKK